MKTTTASSLPVTLNSIPLGVAGQIQGGTNILGPLGPRIGDFPDGGPAIGAWPHIIPNVPYVPNGVGGYPLVGGSWGTITTTSAWRSKIELNKLILSVDMPGIRPEDINVDIEGLMLRATGKRFDTNVQSSQQYQLTGDFDASSAEASLEAGVLTITVTRVKSKISHKVPVIAK